ncbi:hypothetical protein EDD16DRAFT_1495148 [Pisolithus croceorrhizus]|nr:hypothetical protein EV401DRAFT_1879010 [Pisolithus croceorrhizus]KAI6101983.1 hypothetical protein EDD16DRAFT_1495148 [Pisolithus croceorrhizus]
MSSVIFIFLTDKYQGKYLKWSAANAFKSMLPNDVKHMQSSLSRQLSLEGHLVERGLIVQYLEAVFHEATVSWLIEMDQLIHALQHPSFGRMIEIASCTKNGIRILSHQQTCQAIINAFKTRLLDLHKCFLVSMTLIQKLVSFLISCCRVVLSQGKSI